MTEDGNRHFVAKAHVQHFQKQGRQGEDQNEKARLPDAPQHMDRALMDAENDQKSDEAGGNLRDPLRDLEADGVGLFDERHKVLYFGAGDQKGVSDDQPDDDDLREIALDKGREDVAREDVQKEIQDAGDFAPGERDVPDRQIEQPAAQEHRKDSEDSAVQKEPLDDAPSALAGDGDAADSAYRRQDGQEQDRRGHGVQHADKRVLQRSQDRARKEHLDLIGKDPVCGDADHGAGKGAKKQDDAGIAVGALERNLQNIAPADIPKDRDQADCPQKLVCPKAQVAFRFRERIIFTAPELENDIGPVPVKAHLEPEGLALRKMLHPAQKGLLDREPDAEDGVFLQLNAGQKVNNLIGRQVNGGGLKLINSLKLLDFSSSS